MVHGTGPTIIRPKGYDGCQFAHILYTVALLSFLFLLLGRLALNIIDVLTGDYVSPGIGGPHITMGVLWLGGLIVAIVSKKGASEKMEEFLVNARKVGINGIISFVIIVLITPLFEAGSYVLLYLIWWIWYFFKAIGGISPDYAGRSDRLGPDYSETIDDR